jgi:hypothetical protein
MDNFSSVDVLQKDLLSFGIRFGSQIGDFLRHRQQLSLLFVVLCSAVMQHVCVRIDFNGGELGSQKGSPDFICN